MLLILSEPNDAHIPFLTPKLEERGVEYLWFDPACFPAESRLSLHVDTHGSAHRTLHYRGREYDLATVSGVWDRRPGLPRAHPHVHEATQRTFVELASRHFLQGIWETLQCCWLPARPATVRYAENKLVQLELATRLGFGVPETLITNDPEAFLDLRAARDTSLITKSLVSVGVERAGEQHGVVFTHVVHRRAISNYQAIRYAPAIFQAYVPKRVEVRVTVVGDRVFAAEIGSQTQRQTRYDWRHYDDARVPYTPHRLPLSIEQRCQDLVQALGLAFGALDLILTPDGEYVFLELNANGQWGFVELATGLPIAAAIADFLTGPHGLGANA